MVSIIYPVAAVSQFGREYLLIEPRLGGYIFTQHDLNLSGLAKKLIDAERKDDAKPAADPKDSLAGIITGFCYTPPLESMFSLDYRTSEMYLLRIEGLSEIERSEFEDALVAKARKAGYKIPIQQGSAGSERPFLRLVRDE